LMGVGIGLANKAGVLNVGGEGQYLMGAIVATSLALATQEVLPEWLGLLLSTAGAILIGATWAALAGFLKAYMEVNEIIATIIMNWLAFRLLQWALRGPLKDPTSPHWPMTPPLRPSFPELVPGTTLHVGFVMAIFMAILTHFILYKTVLGYKLRLTSFRDVAIYGGIDVRKMILLALTYSGGLAGLAGALDVLGTFHFLYEGISIGLGYTAIVVMLVGKSDPLLIIPSAIMFGSIYNGLTYLQAAIGVSYTLAKAIEGTIYIVFLVVDLFTRFRVKVMLR